MSTYVQGQVVATPRIYYHEEKLHGNSIETKFININAFDYILREAPSEVYKSTEKNKMILIDGEFDFVPVDMFKYCVIRRDGITYKADEGSFYLPEAIVLLDVSDYLPFPSEFYFVAKIDNQLELCLCSGGEGVKWNELPDRIQTVNDPEIIKKAEETIDDLKDRIAYDLEQLKEEEAEKEAIITNRKSLSEKKMLAYNDLTKLCMPDSPKKEEVLSFITGLKEYDDNEEYGTTYDEFRMYLNHNSIPFIITLDWKEAVKEFEAWVKAAVEENFRKTFKFDHGDKYDEDSTVSDDGVFAAFDQQLHTIGLQITMIETDGDEYQLIIHPTNSIDKVSKIMTGMDISKGIIP